MGMIKLRFVVLHGWLLQRGSALGSLVLRELAKIEDF